MRLVSVLINRRIAEGVDPVVLCGLFPALAYSFACIAFSPFFCADPDFCLYSHHIRVVLVLTFDLEIPSVQLTSSNA
jgi:hypothetical protein